MTLPSLLNPIEACNDDYASALYDSSMIALLQSKLAASQDAENTFLSSRFSKIIEANDGDNDNDDGVSTSDETMASISPARN